MSPSPIYPVRSDLLKYFLIILLIPAFSYAPLQAQSIQDIVKRSEDVLRGKSSYGTFRMSVTTPDFERTMEMESWWKGDDKALIIITAPRREAGNKTLKVDKELWMYLRNTETTIKIPPSMMLQSWNGSDFTNDDLVRESSLIDDYSVSLEKEEKVDDADTWKVKLVPKPDAPVVWGSIMHWVRKSDYLPARSEYYDDRGNLVRTMEYGGIKTMGGRKLPTTWSMTNNAKPGNKTVFEYLDVKFDVEISDRVFSLRQLERGPLR